MSSSANKKTALRRLRLSKAVFRYYRTSLTIYYRICFSLMSILLLDTLQPLEFTFSGIKDCVLCDFDVKLLARISGKLLADRIRLMTSDEEGSISFR